MCDEECKRVTILYVDGESPSIHDFGGNSQNSSISKILISLLIL